MRGKKIKELRKYLDENFAQILIMIRNEFGSRTEQLDDRGIYKNVKKLYKMGKIKLK